MSPKTLKEIKNEISKLHQIYDALVDNWNGQLTFGKNATYPITIIISVILNNMAFDASGTCEYSHEKAEKDLQDNLETLRKLNEYTGRNYMTHFPFTKAETIIIGYDMNEDGPDFGYFDSKNHDFSYPMSP